VIQENSYKLIKTFHQIYKSVNPSQINWRFNKPNKETQVPGIITFNVNFGYKKLVSTHSHCSPDSDKSPGDESIGIGTVCAGFPTMTVYLLSIRLIVSFGGVLNVEDSSSSISVVTRFGCKSYRSLSKCKLYYINSKYFFLSDHISLYKICIGITQNVPTLSLTILQTYIEKLLTVCHNAFCL